MNLVQNLQEKERRQGTMIDGLSAGGGGHGHCKTKGHLRQQGTDNDRFEQEQRTNETIFTGQHEQERTKLQLQQHQCRTTRKRANKATTTATTTTTTTCSNNTKE
jgi:hypothetical protein